MQKITRPGYSFWPHGQMLRASLQDGLWPCLFCLQYLFLRPDPPRNDWPARPLNPSLLSTGPWASPAPQPLTFIERVRASPAPKSLTFIDRAQASSAPNPSLLLARPSLLLSFRMGRVMAILRRPCKSLQGAQLRLTTMCRYKIDTAKSLASEG